MMKPSKFNITVGSRSAGRCFIFNSRTRAILELPRSVVEAVRTGDWEKIPKILVRSLLRQGVLVPAEVDEIASVESSILKRRVHKDVRLVLIPTYRCNLRCPYCYEGEATTSRMPDLHGWADDVVNFTATRLGAPDVPGATVAFFGGEPLLAAGTCLDVARGVYTLTRQENQKFYCTLTTNGSILTPEVEQLLHYVHSVQVTLDGVGAEHDRLRCSAGNRGTYGQILKFIAVSVASGVENSSIRFHLHHYSDEYLRKCARELLQRVGRLPGVQIYFSVVAYGCYDQVMTCAHVEQKSLNVVGSLLKARQIFRDEGWEHGQIVDEEIQRQSLLMDISCGMIGSNSFLIDGHREVYFCPTATRNKRLLLGRMTSDGVQFQPLRRELTHDWVLPGSCRGCRVLPLCQGGCYAKAVVNLGCAHKQFCELARLDLLIRRNCASYSGLLPETLALEDELQVVESP